MKHKFQGVYVPLTTPFESEEISLARFRENIEKFNTSGVSGYVVLGSTGENVYLSDEESEKLVQAAREAAASRMKIIVGTGRESTRLTLEFVKRISRVPVDAILVKTPSYFKFRMTREALRAHYLSLAEGSSLPLIIYNFPQNTGISVDSQLLLELSRHENISGIKDSSGNISFLAEVIPNLPSDFSFLIGHGSVFFSGLLLGACGAILAMANVASSLCVKLYNLFEEGKIEEARALQLQLLPLNKTITENLGIAAIKYALDLLGFYGGPVRSPLLPLDEKEKKEVSSLLAGLSMLMRKV